MTIAREEIFGPVLCIIGYENEDEAVRIANDPPYGLSGFVSSGDIEHARRMAKRIRAATCILTALASILGLASEATNNLEMAESGEKPGSRIPGTGGCIGLLEATKARSS